MPTLNTKKNNSMQEITVNCPNCQTQVIWNSQQKNKPFCSERCKLIDLGEWAAGEKAIPGEALLDSPSDLDFDSFSQ